MAFSSSNPTNVPVSWSIGPFAIQVRSISAESGDTSGTVTCDKLSSVVFAVVTGLTMSAAPTYSGNQVTLAFTDPAATVHGQIIAFGRK